MSTIDLEPAARRLGALVAGITDDQLDRPTPCPDYRLGDLVEHVGGLAVAFRQAATKDLGTATGQGPAGDASRLAPDWRTRIPQDLASMAEAWRAPDAWTGMTAAGGVELPGEVAGLVALDELVVHGWDVARAAGQPYDASDEELAAVQQFAEPMVDAGPEERAGLFGPPVAVAEDAPLLHRVLGMTGRDPAWAPPG
jgi:uncharacterized protein (TIGR03086 family)